VDEAIRAKVLELLRIRSVNAHKEIEKLLGWRSSGGALMPYSFIAAQIGISSTKIYTIINKERHQQAAELRQKAGEIARRLEFISYTSSILQFKIIVPKDWKINKDELVKPIDSKELEKLLEKVDRELPDEIRASTSIPLIFFRKEDIINSINLYSMIKGAFIASCNIDNELANIELILLSLPSPKSPMDIYLLSKRPAYFVPSGSRPRKGITVDGLTGIKYYHSLVQKDKNMVQQHSKFINIYLTDQLTGWIISCSTPYKRFIEYLPVFNKVINSFQRLKE
jgi:hypothetical protein